jgi:hypothetical protein
MTMSKAPLSPSQAEALAAARARPLTVQRHGWANDGLRGFPSGTINALVGRKLIRIDGEGKGRRAVATIAGRAALDALRREKVS